MLHLLPPTALFAVIMAAIGAIVIAAFRYGRAPAVWR
jgi:hypothetical protein